MILFETPRLLVRQYDLSDEDSFFLLNGNEEVVRYIRPAKTRVESDLYLRQVIETYKVNPLYGRWAAVNKIDQHFVVIPVEGKEQMQLGYALLPENWGEGICNRIDKGWIGVRFYKNRD